LVFDLKRRVNYDIIILYLVGLLGNLFSIQNKNGRYENCDNTNATDKIQAKITNCNEQKSCRSKMIFKDTVSNVLFYGIGGITLLVVECLVMGIFSNKYKQKTGYGLASGGLAMFFSDILFAIGIILLVQKKWYGVLAIMVSLGITGLVLYFNIKRFGKNDGIKALAIQILFCIGSLIDIASLREKRQAKREAKGKPTTRRNPFKDYTSDIKYFMGKTSQEEYYNEKYPQNYTNYSTESEDEQEKIQDFGEGHIANSRETNREKRQDNPQNQGDYREDNLDNDYYDDDEEYMNSRRERVWGKNEKVRKYSQFYGHGYVPYANEEERRKYEEERIAWEREHPRDQVTENQTSENTSTPQDTENIIVDSTNFEANNNNITDGETLPNEIDDTTNKTDNT